MYICIYIYIYIYICIYMYIYIYIICNIVLAAQLSVEPFGKIWEGFKMGSIIKTFFLKCWG